MAAPVLKTKRPNAAVPPDPGLVEPKPATPRANSNWDATLSATTSVAPTMISSHGAAFITEFRRAYILHLAPAELEVEAAAAEAPAWGRDHVFQGIRPQSNILLAIGAATLLMNTVFICGSL